MTDASTRRDARRRFGLEDFKDLLDLYFNLIREYYVDGPVSVAIFGSIVRGLSR